MEKTVYLVDNMVVCSKAIAPYLEGQFITDNVWVIDEVIYEARNSRQIGAIKKLQHSIDAKDCERLKEIVVDCIDRYKILKLYEGCGDAILLATALAINDRADGQGEFQFIHTMPIVVTQERGIQAACIALGIQYLSQAGFLQIVKQSSNLELSLGV